MFLDNFTLIYKRRITLNRAVIPENVIFVQGVYKKIYILDRNDLLRTSFEPESWTDLDNVPHTLYVDEIIRYYHYYSDNLVYPYIFTPELINVIEEPVNFIRNMNEFCVRERKWEKASLICKLEKTHDNLVYDVCYYIQNDIISNILQQRREPRTNVFLALIERNQLDQINDKYSQELDEILCTVATKQEKKVTLPKLQEFSHSNFNYYNYQLKDIIWMKQIEDRVDNGSNVISHTYTQLYPTLNNEYMVEGRILYPKNILNLKNCEKEQEYAFYGGNLISEVGLGKTLITYGPILNTKKSTFDKFVEINDTCNYFYKRGLKRGMSCQEDKLPNSFYCQEHRNSIFIDKPKLKLNYSELHNFSFACSDITTSICGIQYLKTESTLVICPNQLCDQWVREYYKNLTGLRVITLITYEQFKNLSLLDLLVSDVVILSYQFLTNPNYIKNLCNLNDYKDLLIDLEKYKHLQDNRDIEYILTQSRTINLNLFYWKRIVIDEVHEIRNNVKSNLLYNTISNLQSQYKWTISATPFAHGFNGFVDILNFTTSKKVTNFATSKSEEWSAYNMLSYDNLITETIPLFRKNTKKGVENEFAGNILNEQVNYLAFTPQERNIYQSYKLRHDELSKNFLIKMCCHVELFNETRKLIQNCKTLNEIQQVISDYHQTEQEKYISKINDVQIEITRLERESENNTELRVELGNCRRELTNSKKILQRIMSTCTYLENVMCKLSEEQSCPICLETISQEQLTIFSCGHTYCWDCISHLGNSDLFKNETHIKCPHCNHLVEKSHIYTVKQEVNYSIENNKMDSPEYFVQETKSTKIGNIIYYLKTQLKSDDKCILFSQWDTLLKKVGKQLQEQNINIISLGGTIYQRKAQIDSFTQDNSIKVLLLSSNNAASGMNLTIANKILFLEPVYGEKEYRKNTENQAIGRADRIGQNRPIDIVRFIIKDTIEEDIYLENQSEIT
jgi:SNF2 family DNA or RNA helicase